MQMPDAATATAAEAQPISVSRLLEGKSRVYGFVCHFLNTDWVHVPV